MRRRPHGTAGRGSFGALGTLAAAAGACASPGLPPGGPPRNIPPRLVAVAPETLAVNARPRSVEFTFDEVVSQTPRSTGAAGGVAGGATGLESVVLVSPRNGSVSVNWGREKVYVRPRRGFRANATYTVTILPGLSDYRNNARDSAVVAVFSTGGALAGGEIRGTIFDWVNNRTAPGAVVEAITADSVPYVALADSTGRFVIPNLPLGAYRLRGGVDVNGNRAIDPREPFDTARAPAAARQGAPFVTRPIAPAVLDSELVVAADTARPRPRRAPPRRAAAPDTGALGVELYAFVHDTLPPRVSTVNVADSVTLQLAFDRPLRPDQPFGAAQVRVAGADSAVVAVREVLTASAADSIAAAGAAARTPADSAGRARAGGAPGAAAPAGAAPNGPPNAAPNAAPGAARADTAGRSGAAGPRLRRPVPPVALVVRLAGALRPNAVYRLTVRDLRSLSGVGGTTTRTFSTPRPPAPAAAPPPARRPAAPAGPPPATPQTTPPGASPGTPPGTPPGTRPSTPPGRAP